MAKELKELEQTEQAEQAEANTVVETETGEEVVGARKTTGLKVERKAFKYKGEQCFDYIIKGKLRGRPVEINLIASDKGVKGYGYMDMVFNGKPSVDFVMYDTKSTDFNGNVTRRTTYEIQDVDPDTGVVYHYKVRMKTNSDAAMLDAMLMERAAIERAAAKAGA